MRLDERELVLVQERLEPALHHVVVTERAACGDGGVRVPEIVETVGEPHDEAGVHDAREAQGDRALLAEPAHQVGIDDSLAALAGSPEEDELGHTVAEMLHLVGTGLVPAVRVLLGGDSRPDDEHGVRIFKNLLPEHRGDIALSALLENLHAILDAEARAHERLVRFVAHIPSADKRGAKRAPGHGRADGGNDECAAFHGDSSLFAGFIILRYIYVHPRLQISRPDG